MKKYIIAFVALLACTFTMTAAEKTQREQSFAKQISDFLRAEGYQPSIDDDGDVAFKYQGDKFWVSVEEYDDGYYVKLFSVMSAEDTNRRGVLEACAQTMAAYKYVRCYPVKSSIIYECTSYFSNLYQFKLLFPDLMQVLTYSDKKLQKVYAEYE